MVYILRTPHIYNGHRRWTVARAVLIRLPGPPRRRLALRHFAYLNIYNPRRQSVASGTVYPQLGDDGRASRWRKLSPVGESPRIVRGQQIPTTMRHISEL